MHGPVALRRLRRVLRRVEELTNAAEPDRLRPRVARDINQMSSTWTELRDYGWANFEQAGPALKVILGRLEQTRCDTEITKWKDRIKDNTGYVFRWLADIEKEHNLEGGSTLQWSRPAAHTSKLDGAIAGWMNTWSADNPYDCGPTDDAEDHILKKLDSKGVKLSDKVEGGDKVAISDTALLRALKNMTSKAAGADGWLAGDILRQTPDWRNRVLELWGRINDLGGGPEDMGGDQSRVDTKTGIGVDAHCSHLGLVARLLPRGTGGTTKVAQEMGEP